MTRTEERLKDALHASAHRVQDHRLRPFPDLEPSAEHKARPSHLWPTWLIPVAAAASVVLVIGLVMAVTGGLKHQAGSAPASPAAGRNGSAGVPEYFMDTEGSIPPGLTLVVYSTSTGAKVASAPAPVARGWNLNLDAVAAAPDDRTFYAAYDAVHATSSALVEQIWIYRMSIPRAGSAASLTRIKGGEIPGVADLGGGASMAISPDGTELAMTADTTDHLTNTTEGWADKIIVVDLATGARSVWQGGLYRSGKTFTIPDISWTPDGRSLVYLALWCGFSAGTNPCTGGSSGLYGYRDAQVRSLTVGTGSAPLDHSLLLLSQSARYPVIAAAIAGPDDSDLSVLVMSGRLSNYAWSKVAIDHVSASGGSLLGVDYMSPATGEEGRPEQSVISTDPSGQHLLFSYDGPDGVGVGWISNGTFHPLPPRGGGDVVW